MPRRLILGFVTFFLIAFVYLSAVRVLLSPWIQLPPDVMGGLFAGTLALVCFSLFHALYALGWRHTLVFFLLSLVISWIQEQIGVTGGGVFGLFGAYHYSDLLGMKLGEVPILIPLCWFMMIYPSYVLANFIVDDRPTGSQGRLAKIVWLSFLSAMIMTAWDLVIDPILSGSAFHAWTWEQGGPYFGVPLQNYAGWVVTTFMIYLPYRLFECRVPLRPMGSLPIWVAVMPLIAYGSVMIGNSFAGEAYGPKALQLIGPFVMGIPLLAAGSRVWGAREKKNAHPG